MSEIEHTKLENSFGLVTNKRLVLRYKNGNEEIPISKVTSVSYNHKRGYFFAIGNFSLTIVFIFILISSINTYGGSMVLILLLLSLFCLLTGIANWVGNYEIVISINGNNRKPISVPFSKTKEGLNFVNSVKKEISI